MTRRRAAAPSPDAVLSTGTDASNEPVLDVDDIQGNLLPGFGVAHQIILGLRAAGVGRAEQDKLRRFLRELAPDITTLRQMGAVRDVRRAVARATHARPNLPDVVVSASLSWSCAGVAGLPLDPELVDPLFVGGMPLADLGDLMAADGTPKGWRLGHDAEHMPDVLIVVGSDDLPAAHRTAGDWKARAVALGLSPIYQETGSRLTGGIEHFGFRDDISQPAVRGRLSQRPDHVLTRRYIVPTDPVSLDFARPGQRLVWPGQFVFGLPTQLDNERKPGPIAEPPHEWMRNGSYLVFRRLRQDVAAFRTFADHAAEELTRQLGFTVDRSTAEAWIVGRWKDGTPLVRAPGGPNAEISEDIDAVNGFAYAHPQPAMELVSGRIAAVAGDPGGLTCPHFAHVRKVNPRDLPTDQGPAIRFRLLRRGIPYGPPYDGAERRRRDRGLLFFSYQRSLAPFLTVNTTWMNSDDAPESFGHDLLVGQDEEGRRAVRVGQGGAEVATLPAPGRNPWVIPTGGGFFFTPSVSALAGV